MVDASSPWTADTVANRFEEAATTAHRLPRAHPQGYFNPWMSLAMQAPERYPDPERIYRLGPPAPQAVDRMLEVMQWVQWLDVDQRHLVWMRANRYEWQQIGRRFACDRNTASRRWHRAMELVAYQLNRASGPARINVF